MNNENFIIFSTADWDNPFWTNKQHVSLNLAKRGHKILYIESLGLRAPTIKTQDLSRIIKRIFSFFKGARKVHENIWVYSPLVIPFHRYKIIRLINYFALVIILKYYKWKLSLTDPIVWTYNPIVLKYMSALSPKKMVYHAVDDLAAAPGMNKELIIAEQEKLLKKMDIVFCTSLKLYESFKLVAPKKTHYFSNVVDYKHFSKALNKYTRPEDLKGISKPLIGFIGAISEYKLDLKLIKESAKRRPDINWVLIGKIGEGQPLTSTMELESISNIHMLGPKDYKDLPKYLHFFDVCTIPSPINDYTNAMFPMKYYEYMAAEKPIVASNIDSLKENHLYHYSYNDLEEFLDVIDKALNQGVKNKEDSINLVKENTWEKRLDKMLTILFSNDSK